MRPQFREEKATEAAVHLLRERGGKMSYMKLLKLMYLADREALLRWGRPITFDAYVSMKNGPVLSRTYNLISEGVPPGVESPWVECISEPRDYSVTLRRDCEPAHLSRAEVALLSEIFRKFGHRTRWDLVNFSHTLPEWKDPGDSTLPISYESILEAAGRSAAEIDEIREDLEASAEADRLFG